MTKKRHSVADVESNEDIIRDCVKKRASIKGKLTLFVKFVQSLDNSNVSETQKAELRERLQRSQTIFDQFTSVQDELDLLVAGSQIEKELQERESFENQYYSIVASCKCILKETPSQNNQNRNTNGIKLPTITLQTFDGKYDKWIEFRDTYLSLIHKSNNLDDIQKFHYLRSVLSGSALEVIKALEFSSENYNIAWGLLENRFNNGRLLVHNHVKAIFSAQSISKESASQIRKLIDSILRNIRALKSLGEPTESWDTLLIHIIVSKLDSTTEREWELHKGTISKSSSLNKISLSDLLSFLKDRADFLETIKPPYKETSETHNTNTKRSSLKSHSHVTHKNNKPSGSKGSLRYKCIKCDSNHPLYSCESFLALSSKDKLTLIDEKKLCRNCLRDGHAITECWFGPCKHCNKKHNTLIHNEFTDTSEASANSSQNSSQSELSSGTHSHLSQLATRTYHTHNQYDTNTQLNTHYFTNHVLLSTALVEIADKNNKYHTTRALLDNGSQHCFISDVLCKKLNIPKIQSTVQVIGVGNSITNSTQSCQIQLRSKTSSYVTQFNCLVLSRITSQLPPLGKNHNIEIPHNVQLADPEFHLSYDIHLLIGADKYWELLSEGLIRLPKGPYLQNTKLGWVISGSVSQNASQRNRTHCNHSHTLDYELKRFWELEEINTSTRTKLTKDELECENLFTQSTLRDDKGRFSVRIPLRESADVLNDTFCMAQNRFLALERKLIRSGPTYRKLYIDFMKEYLRLGHMSRIENYTSPYYFLPHHGVYREHSSTTKLRVVFDASAKSTSSKSLNDIQHTGPALQNDIFSILLRFRQFKYVACADVENFFRQIMIQPDQRNLQLILWRSDPSEPLGMYQLNTVTYGTASAPYLSNRCVKQLAFECKDDVIARVIQEDMYVDDLITGHSNRHRLLEICNDVSKVLESGCFRLRKWVFSSSLPSQSPFTCKELSLGDNCHTKTLGLGWFHPSDELYFNTKCDHDAMQATKRHILSIIAQIYDPLGLLAPIIITAKILLQRLWLAKIGWDDVIPKDILVDWQIFIEKLRDLQNLRIPRYVIGDNTHTKELHIFSDASSVAYGGVAYLRSYTHTLITVHLLCAKSKVAPVKPVSIPRLELCGAVIAAKLYAKIIKSLRLKFDKVYFWSDSTIVLGWLKMSPNLLKTFVQNRVVEINDITGDLPWFHVAGTQNPADLLSRGVHTDVLKTSDLWWHGPPFLRVPNEDWSPDVYHSTFNCDELPELKVTKTTMVSQTQICTFPFERFSCFNRMRRVVAYMMRFVYNCRYRKHSKHVIGCLSLDELNCSLRILTRMSQQQSFEDIYDDLINKRLLKCSRNISGLNIFLDNHAIIRVGGRLTYAESFSYDKKHPILLCAKHIFTRLLFQYKHKTLLHIGGQQLLATIRETWWPIKGRNLAKQTVHACLRCARMKAKPFQVQMGNLPSERVEPGFPFIRCGVDYAGPLFMLNRAGRVAKLVKCYICLFVCFTTHAVHLELVTSLSTEAYILALKRFISRRGKPLEIFSDNGKNFVGALKEFSNFLVDSENNILEFTNNNSIKFTFIPPYAPHFGGLWEAGIKSCKFHLYRVLGNSNLTYEELSTLLAQIEAVLNSRPMTPLSTDPTDYLPLCPAHFLIGRPLTSPASEDLTMTVTQRLSRYDRVEQIRQNFWKRWSKEYISELQRRTKWQTNQDSIVPDTLILIKEDNLPPLKWCLGRVTRTFPGRDGITRVAEIRTAKGLTRRAFSKICPLLPYGANDGEQVTSSLEADLPKPGAC